MRPKTLLSHYASPYNYVRDRALRQRQAQLPQLQREHSELLQDLQMARELQQGLLLQSVPRLPGWEIVAVSLPATELGGDLYDFVALPEQQGVMIGDVSGHGLAAALRMAVARTLFRQYARAGQQPGLTLAALNRALIDELPTGMVTLLYARIDTATGTCCIANAGHMFPVVMGVAVTEAEVAGLPLGIDVDEHYAEITARLAPGETLLLYTDGLTEATNDRGHMYGYGRLQAVLSRYHHQRPRALLRTILHEMRGWGHGTLVDDVTVLVIRRRLLELNAELQLVCVDVLGDLGAELLWSEDVDKATEPAEWLAQLPEIGQRVADRHGRGLSRELIGELRNVLDEYPLQQHGQLL